MNYWFISHVQGYTNSLLSTCKAEPHDPNRKNFSQQDWNALWDTGATNSVITPTIVKTLNLTPVSFTTVSGVHGQAQVAQYYIDLGLPNGVIAHKILVSEGNPYGCDLLIGMDIIGHGDFMVSCCGGTTHFGFKIPSSITMTEMTNILQGTSSTIIKTGKQIGRNSVCTCGSGKKYKQCCGKV
jgi:hypothetical protein